MLNFIVTTSLNENPDAKILRNTVFVDEQGFEECFDENDENNVVHVVLYEGDIAVATARAILYDNTPDVYLVGRCAVAKEHRKNGYGKKVIEKIEECLKEKNVKEIIIHSQDHAQGFYENLGYKQYAPVYKEQFCMHVPMKKVL